MLHHSAHTGWGMCIVTHDWAHDALWCATECRRVLCSSQYVFFMSQGGAGSPVSGFRGLGARFQVSGFWFQVSSFWCHVSGTPLLCPPKIGVTSPQGGGGMTNGKRKGENGNPIAHPLFFTYPLRFARPPNLEGQSGGG